jgi:hypothetical protein
MNGALRVGISLDLFFEPEDGGDMFLRKISCLSTEYAVSDRGLVYSGIAVKEDRRP